ncbi:general secretion pathway protein GspK, partial [Candidatus Sumerlaeota bacterium]|nr:general secretion pathway protein GspK [Candidatus Sumerlaeota bacterium]
MKGLEAFKSSSSRSREKGVILLVTLWIAVVLAIIAYSLSYQVRLEMKLTKQFRQSAQARALAQAGIAKAVADLKNDLIIDTSEGGYRFDAEGDVWANPNDKMDIEYGPGKYSVLIIDKDSLININTARFQVLKELLLTLGVEEDKVEDIAYAIIDWRDPDDRPAGGKGEKENTYYSSLIKDTEENEFLDDESKIVYRCKNEPFLT